MFVVNDIEMGVEGGGFIDGGHGQIHERRQGTKTGHGEVAIGILDRMQVLDQSVTVAQGRISTFVADQFPQLRQHCGFQLSTTKAGTRAFDLLFVCFHYLRPRTEIQQTAVLAGLTSYKSLKHIRVLRRQTIEHLLHSETDLARSLEGAKKEK